MKVVKNGTSKLHTCNGQKLAKILEKKDLNARQFSVELGYNATYLPKVIRTNKIGETAVCLLLSKGIKPDQYDVDMKRTVKSKDPVVTPVTGLDDNVINSLKRNSGRYPFGAEDKSPAEKAMDEPGVVKVEFTLDIVKLKAIIKAAVKEAYEEL